MEGRRARVAPLHDFAVPGAKRVKTYDAINRIAIAPMSNQLLIDGDGEVLDKVAVFIQPLRAIAPGGGRWLALDARLLVPRLSSRVTGQIDPQMPTWHRSRHQR